MRELERRGSAEIAERDLRMALEDRVTNKETADRDRKMVDRSHRMEVLVILLIAAELLLVFVTLVYSYIENGKQQGVLETMNRSAGDTVTAMSSTRS